MRRYLVAGNWKMNGTLASAQELARAVAEGVPDESSQVDVLICPAFPHLAGVKEAVGNARVRVGAQNAYHEKPGAYTGEVALEMLVDLGIDAVILGHSERRHVLKETDELINRKVRAALEQKLQVVLCVGELLSEREASQTEAVLDRQMEGGLNGVDASQMNQIVVAYEPVWAIGTGHTATPDQAQAAHAHLRNWLSSRYNPAVAEGMQILYGGSVKPDNAAELLAQPDVDGALVGGASLKPELFQPIIQAAVDAAQ
ncbi:MAG: triose-phosphate isomerase [Planctomycetota bacterium]|nr:MAG: triose-phosphate isomerase [Planctomycetota bacterium]REK26106.1 MAG: triose-phosphate isomerase [Planctomycetota bacterium]REK27094.1 MAG: triose-phosphate isomerase [Planctomycetota bacterium]